MGLVYTMTLVLIVTGIEEHSEKIKYGKASIRLGVTVVDSWDHSITMLFGPVLPTMYKLLI